MTCYPVCRMLIGWQSSKRLYLSQARDIGTPPTAVCVILGHCLPRWALWNLTFAIFIRCNLRLISCKNEMEPATDGKSLENRLKVSALAWASTLTPPTGYEPPEPPSADGLFCFYLRDRGHLRCCLTPNPTLTLFLWFLDETKVQRWQEEKAERKRSQMMRMLRVWRLETIYHPVM